MESKFENNSEQREFWEKDFGNSYIERNRILSDVSPYKNGITRKEILQYFFETIPKESRILELGCSIGLNLAFLFELGFQNLTGVEINSKAFAIAKRENPFVKFYNVSIEEFNQGKEKFDLVFTSGVLIHINPKSINSIVSKIISLTNRYIYGFEYYSDTLKEVNYRGHSHKLWKQNFPKLFMDFNNKIRKIKEEKYYYKNDICDIAYLLELK